MSSKKRGPTWTKKLASLLFAAAAFAGTYALDLIPKAFAFFQEEFKYALDLQEAKVEISALEQVELYKTIDLEARVDSVGYQKLSPGSLTLETEPDGYISIKPKRTLKLAEIEGSEPVTGLPELKAIKLSPATVKVRAVYRSRDLKVVSNELVIAIVPPVKVVHPHFDRSDIGRVNLAGDWAVELGGNPGRMTIDQGTNNKISGVYDIPDAKWPTGKIDGYKDGATFRVEFTIPGKKGKEKVWVAGHFEIQSSNGDFIEIKGCAYHLRKTGVIYNKAGAEGVDCSKPAYYDRWKVIQPMTFYASAPFDKQE